jgi:antibiotic biosynthesis monooxygenase (ABM) superfamily enzyme
LLADEGTKAPVVEAGDGMHRQTQSADDAVTLVLSRQVTPGHEQAFEQVLHTLATEVGRQPGHLDLTVIKPSQGGERTYTIVSRFASRSAADAWIASEARARLVAEADQHAAGELRTRYLSGLEGWLRQPGGVVVIPPVRWKIAVVSGIGILPLLEIVNYAVAPHLEVLPIWSRPLIVAPVLIALMQYAMMPVLTMVTHGFLYPPARGTS